MPNPGITFDQNFLDTITQSESAVNAIIFKLTESQAGKSFSKNDLLTAISFLDLTSLNGNDTPERISNLLQKAQFPLAGNTVQVAAVCVYQPFIAQAVSALKHTELGVACVAGGFPAGQMDLAVKCADIEKSVQLGATEIDMVINRTNPLTGNWSALYEEVRACRQHCGQGHLKVIIATGELVDYTIIAKTSWVCMMAGADFIKTSTGLEKVNATLEAGLIMAQAIRDFHKKTGIAVGFKPAGGIRTTQQAMTWLALIREELGEKWLDNSLFRIGASSLLDDLAAQFKAL
jgi:deoxyribose-phosphate aldolase